MLRMRLDIRQAKNVRLVPSLAPFQRIGRGLSKDGGVETGRNDNPGVVEDTSVDCGPWWNSVDQRESNLPC